MQMTLKEFYDELSRSSDTAKTKIDVADTDRVFSEAFEVSAAMDAASCADLVAKGLSKAKQKLG
jgi:hypothetical protein